MKKLIYFGAEWCGQCKVFRPQVEKESKRLDLDYQYVDVEDSPEMAVQYAVRNVPLVVLLDEEMNLIARGLASEMLPRLKEYVG